ncbi:Neurogenic locus notch protein isoform 2 [Schistosoma japonicum]|uniref:Neurogenic locus notch protein isoform 2 n=1 Tax=Schistosoma japonicum TaxID=6182 RepID=A0A4Z2DGG6_SCHJA|nr:Neurogenic locus notch protein isoform 2 [Schistosoma japonicum]
MSSLTLDCTTVFSDSVDYTCETVNSCIKSTYVLMAKCEELSKSMSQLEPLKKEISQQTTIMCCFLLLTINTLLHTLYCNPLYFVYQEKWPTLLSWKCSGTPVLKAQRVQFIEEATKIYYDTLMSGRLTEDRNLDIVIPPNIISTSEKNLGNSIVMQISCELMNNLKWVKEVYNRVLSRNTETFRAILDIIYRLGLCFRDIEPHLNCPNVCRSKTNKFCYKKLYTIGYCNTYINNELIHNIKINSTNQLKQNELKQILKNWLFNIPIDKRLPLEFFLYFINNIKLLQKTIDIQLQITLIPYCPCEVKYTYDKISDSCLDVQKEYSCNSGSYCANGGTCLSNLGMDDPKIGPLCQCLPAFRGDQCEHERDPCEDEAICDPFPCVRDPHNFEYGFRCQCPPTHQYEIKGKPKCVPKPVCGEYDATNGLRITRQPCQNRGQCIQDANDSMLYQCICIPGYKGDHCEIEPTPAIWSEWSPWSNCIWPDVNEICNRKAYRQQTRICITNAVGQKCIGQPRRITHTGCDLTILSSKLHTYPSQIKKDLIYAAKLCDSYNQEYITPLGKYELDDSLTTAEGLDNWDKIDLDKTKSITPNQLQSVNYPMKQDYIFITGWIYVIILHLGTILLWIYYIHRWRTEGRD